MLSNLNLYEAFKACKQFAFGIFVVLIILRVSNNCVNGQTIDKKTNKDISIPEAVIQCHAACIQHFLLESENQIELLNCREHNNCAMCWDFCQMLFVEEPKVFKSICSSKYCFKGCKYACSFYNFKHWLHHQDNANM